MDADLFLNLAHLIWSDLCFFSHWGSAMWRTDMWGLMSKIRYWTNSQTANICSGSPDWGLVLDSCSCFSHCRFSLEAEHFKTSVMKVNPATVVPFVPCKPLVELTKRTSMNQRMHWYFIKGDVVVRLLLPPQTYVMIHSETIQWWRGLSMQGQLVDVKPVWGLVSLTDKLDVCSHTWLLISPIHCILHPWIAVLSMEGA